MVPFCLSKGKKKKKHAGTRTGEKEEGGGMRDKNTTGQADASITW